ncbi:MAG TPA: anhydro-N-acetylmuramic acid kinase [Sulfurimonas sp. UBA12504]|nr:MAG: anhydro-N-acetylmuramic acid kinase [Sulfurimonas sp. GWF2_37_8]DAB29204.1 MAG TPA: anhydro-N-acetylmuramic acid kinase [Sulfurimonas sp. UBA12504]
MSEFYIGVMSGTSMDGIDLVLCEIDAYSCKLLHSHEYPFPKELKDEILTAIAGVVTLQKVGTLDTKLGHLFARAINRFILEKRINAEKITAIGLHGQTLWHEPNAMFPFSMQLGCPNVVYSKTNMSVVADFRSMDIANGGQGAPFAPAFHAFAFGSLSKNTAVLNIGGMANITLLGDTLKGWDTGPGNVLMDMWIRKCKDENYDKDGSFAKSGRANEELLEKLLADNYFKKIPPKSTGREYFNESWLGLHLPIFHTIKEEDMQATLLELTARTIAHDALSAKSELLIVCGGGAKNGFLMQRLYELCGINVVSSDTYGINADALEAMAFAWLAYKRIHREKVNLQSVTGSHKNSLLGGIYG